MSRLYKFGLYPVVLKETREQNKVFGLLLTLNPTFNNLIKHLLRADKLPSLEDVCSQVQREQGSLGLFSGKGELLTSNKGIYKHTSIKKGRYGSLIIAKRRITLKTSVRFSTCISSQTSSRPTTLTKLWKYYYLFCQEDFCSFYGYT